MRLAITDLQPGTTYLVEVRAVGLDGNASEWSNRYSLVTMDDIILPSTPSSVTWVASGDSFAATWASVTNNVNSEAITIVRYEIELVAGATTKVVSVAQNTGGTMSYNLSFESNRALFGTPQSS